MISSSEFDTDCSQNTECPLTMDEYIEVKDQCALDSQELLDIRMSGSQSSGENEVVQVKSVSSSTGSVSNLFKGRYNFKFNFPEEEKLPTKCCAFTYSKMLNKLYVRPEQLITIPFSALPLPKKFKLQSFLRFKEQNKVVERCPNHLQNDENVETRHHVLKVYNSASAKYKKDEFAFKVVSKPRLSFDATLFVETFKFGCSSQCRGGINRIPIVIVCQLILKKKVVGSEMVEVNVSQCPGRDRMSAEKNYKKALAAAQPALPPEQLNTADLLLLSTSSEDDCRKDQSVSSTKAEEYPYYITVRGRRKAALLATISSILTEHPELF